MDKTSGQVVAGAVGGLAGAIALGMMIHLLFGAVTATVADKILD